MGLGARPRAKHGRRARWVNSMAASMADGASYKNSMIGCHSPIAFLLSMTPLKLFPPCEVQHHHGIGNMSLRRLYSMTLQLGHNSMSFPLDSWTLQLELPTVLAHKIF